MIDRMEDVFESGFLTFLSSPAAEPISAGFYPILHENSVIAVMLVGHLSADPLAKESLDLYLAAAGLIGATYSRRISETAVLKAKEELEQRVVERTTEEALRHQSEAALRLSEQEFRSLAEAMPQIVWATRPDGWNIYFNQQWVDYTGMTMEESYGHGWNTLSTPMTSSGPGMPGSGRRNKTNVTHLNAVCGVPMASIGGGWSEASRCAGRTVRF